MIRHKMVSPSEREKAMQLSLFNYRKPMQFFASAFVWRTIRSHFFFFSSFMISAENPTRYAAKGMNPVRIPLVFLFIAIHLLVRV